MYASHRMIAKYCLGQALKCRGQVADSPAKNAVITPEPDEVAKCVIVLPV
eukprot:COSAG02_NODE_6931_length_3283_cov_2.278894_1_plen_50_part_00